jgi:hypothetical protein
VRDRWPTSAFFTYWDYRAGMFHQDLGMRIDLILASAPVADRVQAAWVDRQARKGKGPSDHAPVIVDLDEAPDGDIGPVVPPPSAPAPRRGSVKLPQARRGRLVARDDAQVLELAGREVRITSPDKVLFAERGETKLDLVRYYAAVAEPLMRAMGGRPVLMQRFPQGAGGPRSSRSACRTTRRSGCRRRPSRPSTARRRGRWWPPTSRTSPGRSTSPAWASTSGPIAPTTRPRRRAAPGPRPAAGHELRRGPRGGLGAQGAAGRARHRGFPKTTGNRGLHVYVRLAPRWDSYEVRSAAVAAARELERRRPDILTAAWWKEERAERIFVDYNQNAPHKTVFGAWSVRARTGAQVSTPIGWDELDDIDPDELTLASVPIACSATAIPGLRSTTSRSPSSRCWRCTSATGRTACSTRRGRRSTRSSPTSRHASRRAAPAARSSARGRAAPWSNDPPTHLPAPSNGVKVFTLGGGHRGGRLRCVRCHA